jgi:hypothetical protein
MSSETRELVSICEQLPEAQRAKVTDYARSLLAGNAGHADDGGGNSRPTPSRLEALAALQASLALTPEAARRWADDAAAERRAWGSGE